MKILAQADYLNQLKNIGDQLGSSDPRFKKYLDKAIQFAQPAESPDGEPIMDQTGYVKFTQIVEATKTVSDMANTVNDVRKKLQENQVQIVQEYSRIKVITEQLMPFIEPNQGVMLLNDDTRELLETLEEAYTNMSELIENSKQVIEDGFDKVNEVV